MSDKPLARPGDHVEPAAEKPNTLIVDSATQMSSPRGIGSDIAQKVTERADTAPGTLAKFDQGCKFELVSAGSDQIIKAQAPSPEEVQRGIKALLGDAVKGDKWSQDSIDTFKKVFASEAGVPNATPESVARGLNAIGAAINGRVSGELSKDPSRRAEPIGMGVMQNADGSYSYYMSLNKDTAALTANKVTMATGGTSDTVIKLGPFTPKAPGKDI